MKQNTEKVYRCEHCNKPYFRKHFAVNHEKICNKNPDNFRACLNGCKYLTNNEAKVYIGIDDYYTGEPICQTKTLLYCSKRKVFLYPPKSEHKGNFFTEFYDEENENLPMPKECNDSKY